MAKYDFGEKTQEHSNKQGKDVPVWQSPKYKESKAKAEEILDSGKYAVKPSDFWILMNETKTGKMAYTGLIISHNGCLKINDALESKFDPSCVGIDKDGFNNSLVYSYCNKEQGIYEVGEVSKSNCKNDYPYAMAYKRLFDRVVLKLSKLAYAGIYSDSEADEFKNPLNETEDIEPPRKPGFEIPPESDAPVFCEICGKRFADYWDGSELIKAERLAERSRKMNGKAICASCLKKGAHIGNNG